MVVGQQVKELMSIEWLVLDDGDELPMNAFIYTPLKLFRTRVDSDRGVSIAATCSYRPSSEGEQLASTFSSHCDYMACQGR